MVRAVIALPELWMQYIGFMRFAEAEPSRVHIWYLVSGRGLAVVADRPAHVMAAVESQPGGVTRLTCRVKPARSSAADRLSVARVLFSDLGAVATA